MTRSFDYPVSTMSNTILSGVTKKGYWLFEGIPKNSGTGTFTFEIGFMDKSKFSFNVPLNGEDYDGCTKRRWGIATLFL